MPQPIRLWVADILRSRISEVHEQVGGMSPGCATRLVTDDGQRVFVKVVGTPLNPLTPDLFRREITALDLIGSHELWADMTSSWDDGDWVAILLEDVEGRHPDLADDATMSLLLGETERLGTVLAARVPDPPAPSVGGLGDLRDGFRGWADAVGRAVEIPEELLPEWVRRDAAAWEPRVRALADGDVQLVHWDIRNDNLLQRPTGELVFLDWGAASLGPAWVDPLLARLERVESPWFDESLASSPALAAAGGETVDAWLVGFGAFLAWRAHTAVDVNLPTLQAFRLQESGRMIRAAERRLGHG
jgi:aminoglycoside phosphotransferase (APT) family kinase protein